MCDHVPLPCDTWAYPAVSGLFFRYTVCCRRCVGSLFTYADTRAPASSYVRVRIQITMLATAAAAVDSFWDSKWFFQFFQLFTLTAAIPVIVSTVSSPSPAVSVTATVGTVATACVGVKAILEF